MNECGYFIGDGVNTHVTGTGKSTGKGIQIEFRAYDMQWALLLGVPRI